MTMTLSSSSTILSRQSQRLLQIGSALLLYSFFEGFAIPVLASPRIALSVHTLSALQSVLLLALGLVWPRLALGPTGARLAFWFLIYSTVAILAAYTIAAVWGVGIETIRLMGELPDGLTRGTPFQEGLIKVISYSSASGLVSFALIFFGLRIKDSRTESHRPH
jgi:hydroxylaminobenzene mutase